MKDLAQILSFYDAIGLDAMSKVSLMNRQDTKYVFSEQKLPAVLKKLSAYYKILEIDQLRLMSYSNVYFDTDDFRFYTNHHNGKLNRFKIRNRRYDDSDLAFCEVKFKSNKSRTQKQRQEISELLNTYESSKIEVLENNSPVKIEELKAKLFMRFDRITLVHKNYKDRCTIDINLVSNTTESEFEFKNVVIAEIKQDKFTPQCDFNLVLKSEGIYPKKFSKYCMSAALLYKNLKANRFKPRILMLNKILNEN